MRAVRVRGGVINLGVAPVARTAEWHRSRDGAGDDAVFEFRDGSGKQITHNTRSALAATHHATMPRELRQSPGCTAMDLHIEISRIERNRFRIERNLDSATIFSPMKAKYNPALADDMIDFRLCNSPPDLHTQYLMAKSQQTNNNKEIRSNKGDDEVSLISLLGSPGVSQLDADT